MVLLLLKRCVPLLAVVVVLLELAAMSPAACACPFCTMQGRTLTGEVTDAALVLFGKLENSNRNADTTEIVIESIIKDNPVRGKKTRLTLNRYIDVERIGANDRFVVFCDLFRGKIDPYRGMALKVGSKVPEYLRGAMQLKDKPLKERLRFFFDYLDNDDLEISNDAYKEFGNADYNDYKDLAKKLPAARIIKWLGDENTPSFRLGLYASMLGHAGQEKDAAVLRKMLDNPDRRAGSGVDGMFAGYVMLKPKEGWPYLLAALKNTKEDFMFRYAALRAVRFLHDYHQSAVSKKELVNGLCVLLNQEDIADLAIEDLRKWQVWEHTDKVLALRKTDAYKLPIVKRAILRYCLQCQGVPAAAAYVAECRKADNEAVKEALELLELEREAAPSPSKPVKSKPAKK
jgi:hypothetical protein